MIVLNTGWLCTCSNIYFVSFLTKKKLQTAALSFVSEPLTSILGDIASSFFFFVQQCRPPVVHIVKKHAKNQRARASCMYKTFRRFHPKSVGMNKR